MFQYKFTSKRCRTGLLPVGGATRKRARSELGTAASNEATSEINIIIIIVIIIIVVI